jgi:hypothetical protein
VHVQHHLRAILRTNVCDVNIWSKLLNGGVSP